MTKVEKGQKIRTIILPLTRTGEEHWHSKDKDKDCDTTTIQEGKKRERTRTLPYIGQGKRRMDAATCVIQWGRKRTLRRTWNFLNTTNHSILPVRKLEKRILTWKGANCKQEHIISDLFGRGHQCASTVERIHYQLSICFFSFFYYTINI